MAHSSNWLALSSRQFCHCVIGAADDVAGRIKIGAARDHVLHANSTLVNRVDLATAAIAVLSTGSRPLGSCPRAAGWSAATSCVGPQRRSRNVCSRAAVSRHVCLYEYALVRGGKACMSELGARK